MEKGIPITIVIGTLNRPQVVLTLLKQLVEISSQILFEVITIDQSTIENWKILEAQFPKNNKFKLIHFENPHTCKYLNYGWQNALAPIVLYLDDDVTIAPSTIQAHLDEYKNAKVQGVAGRVINDGENITQDGRVGRVLWYGAVFTKNFTYEKPTFVDFPYGCNMSFRREVLQDVGGFDEGLFPPIYAYNELDLGVRINKKWRNSIVFAPKALVYHHQYKRGGTRNDFEIKQVAESNNTNYGYFIGKNFSFLENIICLLRRLPFQLLKEPLAIPSIIRGYISSRATREESNRKIIKQ